MGWMVGDGGVEQIALRYLHIAHGEDQVGLLFIAHQLTKVNSCVISVCMYQRLSNSHFALVSGLATHQLLWLQCNEDDLSSGFYSIIPRNLNQLICVQFPANNRYYMDVVTSV